jgi:hypothetical protein
MDDANAVVARAITEELVRLGLIRVDRSVDLERSISDGTIAGEQWALEIELTIDSDTKNGHAEIR